MAAEPLQRPRFLTPTSTHAALAALLGALASWLLSAPPATAAPSARAGGVPHCELGAYVSDLYDIDPAKDRFSARLWLWTVCPNRSVDPLPKLSYSNADAPDTTDPNVIEQGGHVLDQVRLQSSFRQDWDVRDSPFDHQRAEVLATAPEDTGHFRFTVNNSDSEFNPEIQPRGWRVTRFRLVTADKHYTTTYGDKTLKHGSTYSRVRIQIDLARRDPTAFWKLTTPIYLAVLIATSTFLLSAQHEELATAERLDALHNRLAVLGGALFVTVLNMQQANTVITSTDGLPLIDDLHLTTLAFLLMAVAGTVLSWRWTAGGGSTARAEQLGHRGAWIALGAYVLVCGALVLLAAGA